MAPLSTARAPEVTHVQASAGKPVEEVAVRAVERERNPLSVDRLSIRKFEVKPEDILAKLGLTT